MTEGYIKLYRSLSKKTWYKKSEYLHLWVHLLFKAAYSPKEVFQNGKIVKLNNGEFITGRKQLSLETGIKESTIERILNVFEIEQQIRQQTNSRNRVITILSWEQYQKSEQQTDNKRTTNGHKQEVKKERIKNKEEIQLPFGSEIFASAWKDLTEQPKWRKKTDSALKLSLEKLQGKTEKVAIAMIKKAIANDYQGIFDLTPQELVEAERKPIYVSQYKDEGY